MESIVKWIELAGGVSVIIAVLAFSLNKIYEIAYNRALEDYKSKLSFDLKAKEKAALVAELLSEWTKKPMDTATVNKLLWECSLWLPDEQVIDLNNLFAHSENCKSTKQMIVDIRKVIHSRETKVTPEVIVHFNQN